MSAGDGRVRGADEETREGGQPIRRRGGVFRGIKTWFDASDGQGARAPVRSDRRAHWARIAPFVFLHGGCLAVLFVGVSPFAVAFAIGFYLLRAFFVTAFYHRYFSHRAYRTSRVMQFVFAILGNTAVQRGPLWWAAHHRHHHRTSDRAGDPHSPAVHGLYWSHLGWLTDPANFPTDLSRVPDLAKFRELRWLDRYDTVVPFAMAAALFGLGEWVGAAFPATGTSGAQLAVWGFFVSTVLLLHVTALVNSLAHRFGSRPYRTKDDSRNNWWIALLTHGEGWHNNHHRYPGSARQGFRWWEVDVTYYVLRVMAWLRLVRDLHPVPVEVVRAREGRV